MAAAVVSGAVAQLLDANPNLSPAEVKFALQFTAQHLDGYGLIEQGAGSINVPLAVGLATSKSFQAAPTEDVIGGETVTEGQLVFRNVNGDTMVWGPGNVRGNTMVWGSTMGGGSASWRRSSLAWRRGRWTWA